MQNLHDIEAMLNIAVLQTIENISSEPKTMEFMTETDWMFDLVCWDSSSAAVNLLILADWPVAWSIKQNELPYSLGM